MAMWSDGRFRSDDYEGSRYYQEFRAAVGAALNEELLRLKWDNEYMRKRLEDTKPKAIGTTACQRS